MAKKINNSCCSCLVGNVDKTAGNLPSYQSSENTAIKEPIVETIACSSDNGSKPVEVILWNNKANFKSSTNSNIVNIPQVTKFHDLYLQNSEQCHSFYKSLEVNNQPTIELPRTATTTAIPVYYQIPNGCPCFDVNPKGEIEQPLADVINQAKKNKRFASGSHVYNNCEVPFATGDVRFCCCPAAKPWCTYSTETAQADPTAFWLAPQHCNLFSDLDKYYGKEIDFKKCLDKAKGSKSRKERDWTSLGKPVGLLFSNIPINDQSVHVQNAKFACYLKALGLLYLQDVKTWQMDDINMLMKEGQDLVMLSAGAPKQNTRSDIYDDIEAQINRTFQFRGNQFHIELTKGVWLPNIADNLYNALVIFFKNHNYGLLQIKHWYILIWKNRGIYHILDFNGRHKTNLTRIPNDGYSVVLCLRALPNVVHYVINLSNIQPNESFMLREMMVVDLITDKGKVYSREYGERLNEFSIINDDYSYLISNLHLSLNPAEALRNRSAFSVCLSAMLASKIDHTASWDKKVLDKIICYGVNICRLCWPPCRDINLPLDLDAFPKILRIGRYLISYDLVPQNYFGTWKCVPIHRTSEFYIILRGVLNEQSNILFQINNQMYAIWKKNGYYFLFDPYKHIVWGAHRDNKVATVRMFRSIDILINVFHHILLQSNRTAAFYIHSLKINSIAKCVDGAKAVDVASSPDGDAVSLNEFILFEEDYNACLDELGRYSDYEVDVVSQISSILSIASSTSIHEEEEGEGEGEGEGGDNISGLETDSSGQHRRSKYSKRRKKSKKSGYQGDNEDDDGSHAAKRKRKFSRYKANRRVRSKPKTSRSVAGAKGGRYTAGNVANTRPIIAVSVRTAGDTQTGADKNAAYITNYRESTVNEAAGTKKVARLTGGDNTSVGIRYSGIAKCNATTGSAIATGGVTDDGNADDAARDHADFDRAAGAGSSIGDATVDVAAYVGAASSGTVEVYQNRITRDNASATIKKICSEHDNQLIDSMLQCKFESKRSLAQCEKVPVVNCMLQNAAKASMKCLQKEATAAHITNTKPGCLNVPKQIAVCASKDGSFNSIYKLLMYGFKQVDRCLIMTSWSNFIVFRVNDLTKVECIYYVHDGCTCNVKQFRHYDLSVGTAGLIQFNNLLNVVCYIIKKQNIGPTVVSPIKMSEIIGRVCKKCVNYIQS